MSVFLGALAATSGCRTEPWDGVAKSLDLSPRDWVGQLDMRPTCHRGMPPDCSDRPGFRRKRSLKFAVPYSIGEPSSRAFAGYVGCDEHADLVTQRFGGDDGMHLWRGDGKGGFADAGLFPFPEGGFAFAKIADVDGDGAGDVMATGGAIDVAIGREGLQRTLTTKVDGATWEFTVADYNLDGFLDVALLTSTSVATLEGEKLAIYSGVGDGTFRFITAFDVVSPTGGLATADMDRDGRPDVIVAADQLYIYRNTAAGFLSPMPFPIPRIIPGRSPYDNDYWVQQIRAGDFNGDGWPDILLALRDYARDVRPFAYIEVGLGGRAGTIDRFSESPRDFSVDERIVTADFDGDGVIDLAGPPTEGTEVFVSLGIGDGKFATPTVFPIVAIPDGHHGWGGRWIEVADFNDDCLPDLAVPVMDGMAILLNVSD